MKHLIAQLRKENSNIDKNIFHSVENVNLETVIAYRKGSDSKNFLDDYENR